MKSSLLTTLCIGISTQIFAQSQTQTLINALLQETPLASDLQYLCDQIGGRATGSANNQKAVAWGVETFKNAGIIAKTEEFQMPFRWAEKQTTATISGDLNFVPKVNALSFSAATPKNGIKAPVVFANFGTAQDFAAIGTRAKNAFVLIKTDELKDLNGLFKEYNDMVLIEENAYQAGVKGIIYISSRSRRLMYRHNASRGAKNTLPILLMAREDAQRIVRSLNQNQNIQIEAKINLTTGGSYPSQNVIAEIKGSEKPEEIIVIGAHLDSWDLGTGALDNGCNVALIIDIARQMQLLNIRPVRTIRFALWNGEEQGLNGSWEYTRTHLNELDNHKMALSIDIGAGKINGFYTGGRQDCTDATSYCLTELSQITNQKFEQINAPLVGTDNFDFMMQGIANLVANQEESTYAQHYHSESDTYDKVDIASVKNNAAIVAALTLAFANQNYSLPRQNRSEVQNLINTTDLEAQMKSFGVWNDWLNGTRGIK